MSWLFFAISASFFASLVLVLDKIILTKPIPKASLFAVYVGLTGIYGIFLIPFGFSLNIPVFAAFFSILSGFIFIFSLIPYYLAVQSGDIARVAPLAGTLTAVLILLLGNIFAVEKLTALEISAFVLLSCGGWLIAFQKNNLKLSFKIFILTFSSSLLVAFSWIFIKISFTQTNFVTAYALGRFGEFLAALLLLAWPKIRNNFLFHIKNLENKTVSLFAVNKIFAASFFILQNYAVFLGNASLVQATQGLQYVFLFIIVIFLSLKWPMFLKEDVGWKNILKKSASIILILLGLIILSLSQKPLTAGGVKNWGVSFSKPFAKQMGLDWKETYISILDDLKINRLRLIAYWPEIEKEQEIFDFEDLDWQIYEAQKRDAKIILAIGQKLPRWPECHIPDWVQNTNAPPEKILLNYISTVIRRYKNNPAIWAWQIENEPFLTFGECPPLNIELLNKEIALAKSLDSRPVIITDSGELSLWTKAIKKSDIFGTTMYRVIWNKNMPFGGYFKYPLPPEFFHLKTNVADIFTDIKNIIVIELQAEPWGPKLLYESSFEEEQKSMNFEQFKENIEYAKQVGFTEDYLWGAEWWFKMKKENHPEYWNEIKNLLLRTGN